MKTISSYGVGAFIMKTSTWRTCPNIERVEGQGLEVWGKEADWAPGVSAVP